MLNNEFNYASKNPGVFTDARCYMQWIALQYGMKMPASYSVPASCAQSRGRKDDIQQKNCRVTTDYYSTSSSRFECPPCSDSERRKKNRKRKKKGNNRNKGNMLIRKKKHRKQNMKGIKSTQDNYPSCDEIMTYSEYKEKCCSGEILGCSYEQDQHITDGGYCDWTQTNPETKEQWSQCRLVAAEGFAYNVFQCLNKDGQKGTCSNNCLGVDPNAIIIGGTAVLAASAIAPALLPQMLGIGGLAAVGAVGAGAMMMGNRAAVGSCPVGFCKVSLHLTSLLHCCTRPGRGEGGGLSAAG